MALLATNCERIISTYTEEKTKESDQKEKVECKNR
jgi:hypothetical protein